MPRDDRQNMKRGPYMYNDTYGILKDMTDVTNKNVRDTLDEMVRVYAAFLQHEDAYSKLSKLSDNEDRDKGDIIVELVDVSTSQSGEIIISPVKAKME